MDREKLQGLIIDYIDGKLDEMQRQVVEQELTANADAYKLYEELKEILHVMDNVQPVVPSSDLKSGFEDFVRTEMLQMRKGRTRWFNPQIYRAAAAVALLVVGGGIGYLINESNARRIRAMEQQMAALMEMMGNDLSASQRLQGVNAAMKMEKTDDDIVRVLVRMMNEDPNSNVRLAALEALSRFVGEHKVRKEIIDSLPKQTDPVVQIALIQLLVKIREKEVVKDLQQIIDDDVTIQAVKDEAYTGIMKLS